MTFIIRLAVLGDADSIASCLIVLGYGTSTDLMTDKLSMLAASAVDTVLVADERSVGIVGVVSVHLLPLFHAQGNLARLTALVVREGYRRKGVGRALVAAAEAFAWDHDCKRVEVTSGDHRPDAHTFYSQLGYQTDERRFIKLRSSAV